MPNINDRIGSQNVIRVLSNASAPPTRLINLLDVDSTRSSEDGLVLVWDHPTSKFILSDLIDSTALKVSGISTFSNVTNSTTTGNGALTIAGGVGIAKDVNIGGRTVFAGISTFNGDIVDINSAVDILKSLVVQSNLNVTGITTLASSGGITTTGGDFYVGGDLYVKDDVTYDEINGRNLNVTGVGTIAQLDIQGNVGVSGMMTIGSSSITFDGDNDIINVGTGVTISSGEGFSATAGLAIAGIATITGGLNATLLTAAQSNITSLGTLSVLNVDGNLTLTGASYDASWIKSSGFFRLNDNAKATFGTSDDLQIYHDGSSSYIKDVGTGDLRIRGAADIVIENLAGANSAVFNTDAGVELLWRGASGSGKKFETTQTGAVVTGILTATQLSGIIDGGSF